MEASSERVYFADNMRTLMVLAVVLLHALCAYAAIIPWWHARDTLSPLADIGILLIDPFALPVLFFLSGAFAFDSLRKYGKKKFLSKKIVRLGFPLVGLTALYIPAMVYIGYCRIVAEPVGYSEFLLRWLGTAGDWNVHVYDSMQSAAAHQFDISPHHLWFVSLLLVFMALYALVGTKDQKASSKSPKPWAALCTVGVFMAVSEAGINMLIQDWAWVKWGPLMLFQPTRVPVYLGCFVLGLYFSRNGLFKQGGFPGPVWLWGAAWVLLEGGILVSGETLMAPPGPLPAELALAGGALRSFAATAACMFFLKLAARYGAGRSAFGVGLAAASYDIYLLHMPLVVFLQKILVPYEMTPLVKAVCIFVAATAVCWGVSRYDGRRRKCTAAALLAGFTIICLAW